MPDDVQLGPFTLGEIIGEGAMGIVYRGRHRETGVEVAMKVIRRVGGPDVRGRFQEEVQAHAGLLHPGVVYLFEYGEVGEESATAGEGELGVGNPYVAMELADRGTVRDALPVDEWSTARRLLDQVLDALAYSHARGVVHRDLKPENLLLFDRADEPAGWRAKLADFGIAHAFGREHRAATEQLESAVGTPHYMAPEQFRGRWREYGPWTDLYALGCVAWELVCGRLPFEGDSLLALAREHEQAPRPALEPRFPVPDGLEEWIHRMMAVNPDRRFARAADAARTLPRESVEKTADDIEANGAPEGVDGWAQTQTATLGPTLLLDETPGEEKATDPAPRTLVRESSATASVQTREQRSDRSSTADSIESHPPVPESWEVRERESLPAPLVGTGLGLFGLREPPFVDRQNECDHIWTRLHDVVDSGSARCVFVSGEAGTGKSRLAEWMATRSHELGASRVIRVVHSRSGGPTEGLRGAFEREFRTLKLDRGEVYRRLGEKLPALPDDDPSERERDAVALTEFLRPTAEGEEPSEGPRYQFSSSDQRRAMVLRVVRRLAVRRPVFLWVDDLQWGNEALGVLERLFGANSGPVRVLVAATVRSDVLADRRRRRRRIDRLREAAGTSALELEPLDEAHQRELLEGLLPLDARLAEQLAGRTEGHPLFAMQLLGHWIERGDIEMGERGFQVREGREVELPEDIDVLWRKRIERLLEEFDCEERDDALEALELAVALGREVDGDEWRSIVAEADRKLPEGLVERLVELGLASRTGDGWSFAHGLLVESIAQRAREAGRWERHHCVCARWLERETERPDVKSRARLASHWAEAGRPERALAPLLEACRWAHRRQGVERFEQLLDRRAERLEEAEVPEGDERRFEQRLERANLCTHTGEVREAYRILSELWADLEEGRAKLRARVARTRVRIGSLLDGKGRTVEWAQRALRASRRVDDPELRGRIHRTNAWVAYHRGHYGRGVRHADAAVALAQHADATYEWLIARVFRAKIRRAMGDHDVESALHDVRSEASAANLVNVESRALNELGDLAKFDGRYRDARRYLSAHLDRERELSSPNNVAFAELNLAFVEAGAQNFDTAEEHLDRAKECAEGMPGGLVEFIEDLVRLVCAAGRGRRGRFDRRLQRVRREAESQQWLVEELTWLVSQATERAEELGWEARVEKLRMLAEKLRREGGDVEAESSRERSDRDE